MSCCKCVFLLPIKWLSTVSLFLMPVTIFFPLIACFSETHFSKWARLIFGIWDSMRQYLCFNHLFSPCYLSLQRKNDLFHFNYRIAIYVLLTRAKIYIYNAYKSQYMSFNNMFSNRWSSLLWQCSAIVDAFLFHDEKYVLDNERKRGHL